MDEPTNQAPAVQSPAPQDAPSEGRESGGRKTKFRIAIVGFGLFLIFVVGLFWLATTPEQSVGLTLSFAAGLSMIFLPCTLPMAFVIVPLTMGKNPKKGFLMAVFFGLGLAVTLSFYGVFIAALGKILGLTKATQVMLMVGGGAAFFFGLSEIKLLNFTLPSYSGKFPDFIQKQSDYIKTFLLGLFLGNAGVGCPNPAFYILLGYIASVGDIFNGWFLGFVHGAGRAVPLIFLAILGVLGINATGKIASKREVIERYMGWMLIIIGAFIITFGLFGHDWFVASGIHGTWEQIVANVGGERFGEIVLQHEHRLVDVPNFIKYGNLFFLGLVALTMAVFIQRRKPTKKTIKVLIAIFAALVIFVGISTGWTFTLGTNVHLDHATNGEGQGGTVGDEHREHAADLLSIAALEKLPLYSPETRVDELPYVEVDGVKEFHLEANEFRWEYEKGKWVHVWGYNNQIPGPAIRVSEGDDVRIVVKNNLPDFTTVHWHGLEVPWQEDGVPSVTQAPIPPRGVHVYEFSAVPAGTRFYHTHGKNHITASQQLDMGLSGPFIIDPRKPTEDYDREYTLVLDEWDILGGVNPAVAHVHGAATAGAVPDFNTFTINGRVFPYIDPLVINENERVLLRFINVGTAAFHPMHLHGHSFKVVAKDGFPISSLAQEDRNTITVHPGETIDILVEANNPGPWLLHCHHVHHASAGMITLFQYNGTEPLSDLRAAHEKLMATTEEHEHGAGMPEEHPHN
jgi:cytochrome c-type biogenesis protein